MAIIRAAMVLLVVGLVVAVAQGAQEAAPAPDCSTVLLDMSSCLSYVQNGSKETKPEGPCCQGLKTVIKKSAKCLCEVLKEGGSLGIALNLTRATELPSACKVTTPPALKACAGFESPAPSPPPKSSPSPKAVPPSSKATSPTLPPSAAPAPATSGSNLTQIPAPSPAQSGAHAFLPSSLMLCAALVMIWLSN